MATNADENNDDKQVSEQDLRDLKYGSDVDGESQDDAETDETQTDEEDTGEVDGQTEDQADATDETETFTKKFQNIQGDSPEEYARNLEVAYQNSTTEALRLKALQDSQQAQGAADAATQTESATEKDSGNTEASITDPVSLFMKQKMDEEINTAYTAFSKEYPQVADPTDYNKFTKMVAQLSRTIIDSESRLAPPSELYSKAAIILGWQKDANAEKLNMAVKNAGATGKTTSATKSTPHSKVTDAMISVNRKMYPGKSDAEIRTELEEYI